MESHEETMTHHHGPLFFDIIVVGGGHNGLVCATYLAKAGLKVCVLEKRKVVGGCATTEHWLMDAGKFKVSKASYVFGLFRPIVAKELGLKFDLIPRKPSSYTPVDSRSGLMLGMDPKSDFEQIARFSPTDAANYSSYQSTIHAIARGIDPLFDMDVGDFTRANKMKMSFAALQVLRGAGVAGVGLLLGSASQQLRRWFESEPLLGTLARDSIIGANAGPSSPGTGYVLLHHVMGEINWGSWSYVRGGMGEVSAQIRNAAESVGVKIYPNSEVTEICPECTHEDENNRIVMPSHFDVVTKNGRLLHAKLGVVSNLNPTYTTRLIRPMSMMPAAYRRDVEAIDFKSPVMKLNLALDSLPEIAGKTAPSAQHFGTIHLGAQSIRELDESFEASQAATFADLPMIEMTIPSALDSTLAPDGKHVVSLFVQHVPAGKSFEFWQKHRDEYADKILKIVDEASPGFTSKILRREVLSPFDMEQIWHLSGGNIFHGAMSFDRLFHQRPVDSTLYGPLNSCYATPIQNLYFCGAGAHPGGGVTGAPGRNAAFAILKRIVR